MMKSKKIWGPIGIIATIFALFHLYTSGIQLLPTIQQRGVHLGFVLALIFLWFPYRKESRGEQYVRGKLAWSMDILFALASIYLGYYMFSNYLLLSMVNSPNSTHMFIVATLSVILTLEASRRVLGWALPLIAIIFLIYGLYGDRLPLLVAHSGYSLGEIVANIGLSSTGILGTTLGVAATYVVLFVMFGSTLEKTGAGQFFIDLAMRLVGRFRGGPAKVSVLSSALFGSISGSPVANAVATGVVTIPLMKKNGYKPAYAGAVEAAASTGGMLLPPVMGAASFLIADYLQIDYVEVLKAALIPALLYFISIFVMVDLRSARSNQSVEVTAEDSEQVNIKQLIISRGHLIIPLLILIYLLVIQNFSPLYAAFWSIVSVPFVSWLRKETRLSFTEIIDMLQNGMRNTLLVSIACACAGIVIGVIDMTGIGLRFSGVLIELAGGNLFLLLLLTMISSIILGMGLPPVAAYIILAVLAVPAMINFGVNPLAAHLFIFYYGTLSSITPPMAVAAFATCGISGASPIKTAFNACRLASIAFIVPFMFVYGLPLIFQGSLLTILYAFATSILGVLTLSVALEGYFKSQVDLLSRGLLLISALLLIYPDWMSDLIGLAVIILVFLFDKTKQKIRTSSYT